MPRKSTRSKATLATPSSPSPSLSSSSNNASSLYQHRETRMLRLAVLLIPTFLFVTLEMVYFKRMLRDNGIVTQDSPSVLNCTSTVIDFGVQGAVPPPPTVTATVVAPVQGQPIEPPPKQQQVQQQVQQQRHLKYHELQDKIDVLADTRRLDHKPHKHRLEYSLSSFSRATVVDRAPWLPRRKLCKATCCVEARAVSLDQDGRKIVNTEDGKDLSDITLNKYKGGRPEHLQFQGEIFHEDLLPCLVPGTVIAMENHRDIIQYFWKVLRPNIKTSFVLLMTGTDDDTPGETAEYGADPLLLKVYGTNPQIEPDHRTSPLLKYKAMVDKFVPMGLGLSRMHPQERHLMPYLELNHYTNPFSDKSRWQLEQSPLDFDADVFIHFGLRRPHRIQLWGMLCPNTTTLPPNSNDATVREAEQDANSVGSCARETTHRPISALLSDMSKFRFAISPAGMGWDCYRTYELLLMGVIPIIEERIPESHELFRDLPVIHMANLNDATSKQDFADVITNYIKSDAFQKADFEAGWQRLFIEFRRRQILEDAGRTKEIVKDERGREYYQAYHYTFNNENQKNGAEVYCSDNGSCETPGNLNNENPPAWTGDPVPKLTDHETNWLNDWKKMSNTFEVGSSKGFPDFPKEGVQVVQ